EYRVFVPFIISSKRCTARYRFTSARHPCGVVENYELNCVLQSQPVLVAVCSHIRLQIRPQLLRCASSQLLKNEVMRIEYKTQCKIRHRLKRTASVVRTWH